MNKTHVGWGVLVSGLIATPVIADERAAAAPRETMWAAVETLWSGTPEERLSVASVASTVFGRMRELTESDGAAMLRSLASVLDAETDEWILDRLASQLSEVDAPGVPDLFVSALRHRSPNVRWRAVRHVVDHRDARAVPALLRLWARERRPWVRADVVRALARQSSVEVVVSALADPDDEEPGVVWEMIDAVARVRPPGGVEVLVSLARQGSPRLRGAALRGLAEWDDSALVLETFLGASHSPCPRVRIDALASLGLLEDPVTRDRLVEVFHAPGESASVRATAYGALLSGSVRRGTDLPVATWTATDPTERYHYRRSFRWADDVRRHGWSIGFPPDCDRDAADTSTASCDYWSTRRPEIRYEVVAGADAHTAWTAWTRRVGSSSSRVWGGRRAAPRAPTGLRR